ncbi:hypothetical protein XELAEV_18033199mg [Xenopus laevis]|uniref:SGNH hydrolase-type esterase domain-containing protein n=1 Tax=Xenopus laevis TaxID=8355 RepID=A0A974CKD2_XENLA|nr:hypothetical protein XELAEV_18033199mg [Xenopus laevis]
MRLPRPSLVCRWIAFVTGTGGTTEPLAVFGGFVENSIWRLASWVKYSLAPATWDYYNRVWNQWVDLERYVSGPLEDGVKLDLLLWFLANLGKDCSFTKISKVSAALSYLFKLRGWVDVTKCFIVRQVIKGLRRRRVQGDKRKPVTFGLLGGLFGQLGVVGRSGYEIKLFQLAFSLTFYGAFRLGEIVSTSRNSEGGIQIEKVDLLEDSGRRCIIWLLGHSYVVRAENRALCRAGGRYLGMPQEDVEVYWHGCGGMLWSQLVPQVEDLQQVWGAPDIITLHVGGNDLGSVPKRELIHAMKRDLLWLLVRAPDLIIIWSQMVPRRYWSYDRSHTAIERVQVKVNMAISKFVRQQGGIAVRHRLLEEGKDYLHEDGIHLKDVGMDVFNFGLRGGLEIALEVWRSMRT